MSAPRSKLLVSTLVLMVAIGSLLGGCAAGDEASVETYTDPDNGFSFDYPGDWQVTSGETEVGAGAEPVATVSVGDPEGARVDDTGLDMMMVRVYQLNLTVDDSALPQVLPELQVLVDSMQAQDPTMQITEPLTDVTVGALKGFELSFDFDWDADTIVKSTTYFLFDGDMEYQLVVQAATENWQADQEIFSAFVSSFSTAQ